MYVFYHLYIYYVSGFNGKILEKNSCHEWNLKPILCFVEIGIKWVLLCSISNLIAT